MVVFHFLPSWMILFPFFATTTKGWRLSPPRTAHDDGNHDYLIMDGLLVVVVMQVVVEGRMSNYHKLQPYQRASVTTGEEENMVMIFFNDGDAK